MTSAAPNSQRVLRSQAERGCAFWQREPGADFQPRRRGARDDGL